MSRGTTGVRPRFLKTTTSTSFSAAQPDQILGVKKRPRAHVHSTIASVIAEGEMAASMEQGLVKDMMAWPPPWIGDQIHCSVG